MMSAGMFAKIAMVLGVIASAGGLLMLARQKILPRSRVIGGVFSTIVTLVFGNVVLWLLAIDTTSNPAAALILIFFGALSIQSIPFSVLSIYQPLAVVCGVVAGLAAWRGDLLVITVALGMTAFLLHLHYLDSPHNKH
jgi:hypothetical protein